jgi:hypothetical protein
MPFNQDTRNDSHIFGVPVENMESGSWEFDQTAPEQGSPEQSVDPNNQVRQPSNDDVRYQYWQSQYDKLNSQYNEVNTQNQVLQSRLAQLEQNVQRQEPEPQEEEFPPPPQPPQKPYGFSQQEAMSDPNSDSARYLIANSEYNTAMNQYNLLRSNWLEEKQREALYNISYQQQQAQSDAAMRAQVSAQINQVVAAVQKNYGVDYDTAVDFVDSMSDNSSITMDNLFELYKMRKGGDSYTGRTPSGRYAPAPSSNPYFNAFGAPTNPSLDFQQMQRAQSIPPTMGVHNAQGSRNDDPMIAAFRQVIEQSNKNAMF